MQYPIETRAEARRLWVEEGWTATAISRHFGGSPVPQTILNWAGAPDQHGKTWDDYREERVDALFGDASPANLSRRILDQIAKLLEQPSLDTKQADALSKYQRAFKELIDPVYQVSMIYQALTDYLAFCRTHYPELVNRELIESIRDFKNEARRRLGT